MLEYNEVKPNLNLLSFVENAQTHGRKSEKAANLAFCGEVEVEKKKARKTVAPSKKGAAGGATGSTLRFYTKKAFALEAGTQKLCQLIGEETKK